MKGITFALFLIAGAAQGQEHVLSAMRQQSRELLLKVYSRPDVAEACTRSPDGTFTVLVDDATEFTVECTARRAFLAIIEALKQ